MRADGVSFDCAAASFPIKDLAGYFRELLGGFASSTYFRIFTTNYDILLYWVLMQEADRLKDHKHLPLFRDGFGWADLLSQAVLWPSSHSGWQNVFFLHGALHIFAHKNGVEKIKYTDGHNLIAQIRERFHADASPVIVTEGTSDSKMRLILRNGYLSSCYQSFLGTKTGLVTFGFGFNDADAHIRNAVIMGKHEKIYLGCHVEPGEPVPPSWRAVGDELMRARAAFHESHQGRRGKAAAGLDVKYWSTKSVNVWDR